MVSETKISNKFDPPRKAKVIRAIRRTHNIAKYESIEIITSMEDEIEYDSLEERAKKVDNLTRLLTMEAKRTEAIVFKELGTTPKLAFGKNVIDDGDRSEENEILGDEL
jgi:valyl-tRNA synthetase